MTTIDPSLKQLVSDAEAAGVSIPLVLYSPSGLVRGNTASPDDFRRRASSQLGQMSGFTGAIVVVSDWEYVHLVVQPSVVAAQAEVVSEIVVRVRLADGAAWTAGVTA